MKIINSIDLICIDEATNANKEYHLQIVESSPGSYDVLAQWGRRGGTLQQGAKAKSIPLEKALKIFNKVKEEKLSASPAYVPDPDSAVNIFPVSILGHVEVQTPKVIEGTLKRKIQIQWDEPKYIPQLLNPIDESEVEAYLSDDAWGAQEKKNGAHVQVKVINEPLYQSMKVFNKKGKEIPFIKDWLNEFGHACLLDGEKIDDNYHVFDLLEFKINNLRLSGYEERYEILSELQFLSKFKIVPFAIGYKAKKELYDRLLKEGKEGIVFKRLNATFTPGKSHNTMVKFKFYSEASVRVREGRPGKRSVGMEILDGDKWIPIGNVTIPPNKAVPSIGSVIEVRYLDYQEGGSLYQPQYKEVRTDVDPEECTKKSQLKYKATED
jgi:ATP dependent DNA ligase domain.